MFLPTIRGTIDRRILVNYRVDPDVLAAQLPAPFEPKIINGHGMVGICLIRLKHVRPTMMPKWLSISSENAAHRAAVKWPGGEGVFVWRRDTNSRFNALVGGRVFPGIHHHARFDCLERDDSYEVSIRSDDGDTSIDVAGALAVELPATSIFGSMDAASEFFRGGSLGYSVTRESGRFQGLELRCHEWRMEPMKVKAVRSSFFEEESRFPRGSIAFDSALLMRGIEHEWHGRPDLRSGAAETLAGAAGS
jgi:hypothetical protein